MVKKKAAFEPPIGYNPPGEKPQQAGVYSVMSRASPSAVVEGFAHWNGADWGWFSSSIEGALANRVSITKFSSNQRKWWKPECVLLDEKETAS